MSPIIDNCTIEHFSDLDYVVEFVLFTNYFDSSPYYADYGISDTVLIYKDGTAEVASSNPFRVYRSLTYNSDFSDIIESITDFGDKYNISTKLKSNSQPIIFQ